MVKKILIALLAVLVVIQVFSIDKTNPETNPDQSLLQADELPGDVQNLLVQACGDCHSHTTEYPWYTSVEPISWWIRGHIDNAREHLNFSEWYQYNTEDQHHLKEEIVEVLEEGSMPPSSFKLMHPEARLTDAQRNTLIDYFNENNHH